MIFYHCFRGSETDATRLPTPWSHPMLFAGGESIHMSCLTLNSILGCGWISSEFAKDISDSTLQTSDCLHAITAVGSRDVVKAQDFILKYAPHGGTAQQKEKVFGVPRACGTYEEVIEAAVSSSIDLVWAQSHERMSTLCTSAPSIPLISPWPCKSSPLASIVWWRSLLV